VDTVEGSGRPPRREGAGNRQRIPFGRHGEYSLDSLAAANLTPAETKQATEAMEAHRAYLGILDALKYVVGPDGAFHSLVAIQPTVLAIAFHLAKCGFRQTGTRYVAPMPASEPLWSGKPQEREGWHTPPTITYENVDRP
jgi:hypothetical protein